jgi:hypothetical protein
MYYKVIDEEIFEPEFSLRKEEKEDEVSKEVDRIYL